MTKKEFISKSAKTAGFTIANMEAAYDAIMAELTTALVSGESVAFTGVGKFLVKDVAECQKTNPSTGEKITVAAKKKASFKVSAILKNAINE